MDYIDEQTGHRLLSLARHAIALVAAGVTPQSTPETWPDLPHAGVFVTIRKHEALRGCIGTFSPGGDLPSTVVEMAVAAARDPRFRHLPIQAGELASLRIELSILSERRPIVDPFDFELGRHGVFITHGRHVGCFLPDVATEAGWDKEQLLTELCRQKAGLSPEAWRDPSVQISIFTVQKFRE